MFNCWWIRFYDRNWNEKFYFQNQTLTKIKCDGKNNERYEKQFTGWDLNWVHKIILHFLLQGWRLSELVLVSRNKIYILMVNLITSTNFLKNVWTDFKAQY